MKKLIIFFLCFAVIAGHACSKNKGDSTEISEFILAAEVTNRQVHKVIVDNAIKGITIELPKSESRIDVNIKLTLNSGVSMISPSTTQADYNLTFPADIELSAGDRQVTFSVKAKAYIPTNNPTAKGWLLQTKFGSLKKGISVYKSPPTFKGKNIEAYIALGSVEDGINFHVLGDIKGSKTPAQFYDDGNKEYPIIVNGTYFWIDGSNVANNVCLIYRDGNFVAPNSRAVTRSDGKSDVSFYPTKGVFSDQGNKQYRTDWTYTAANPVVTYAYPAPAPNKAGAAPCPTPSADYPSGGWIFRAQTAIGAGPILIKNNAIVNTWEAELWDVPSGVGPTSNNPRTAIGFTEDNRLLLFVCEGRNQTPSTPGLTLQEVAELLIDIGCTELLNLDGGGSSCMLVNGTETIKPSDGNQRKVVTAVALK